MARWETIEGATEEAPDGLRMGEVSPTYFIISEPVTNTIFYIVLFGGIYVFSIE